MFISKIFSKEVFDGDFDPVLLLIRFQGHFYYTPTTTFTIQGVSIMYGFFIIQLTPHNMATSGSVKSGHNKQSAILSEVIYITLI